MGGKKGRKISQKSYVTFSSFVKIVTLTHIFLRNIHTYIYIYIYIYTIQKYNCRKNNSDATDRQTDRLSDWLTDRRSYMLLGDISNSCHIMYTIAIHTPKI